MTTLSGIIQYKIFAEGTKSESSRPYIILENGSQILLYKKNDNPFENTGFSSYEGQKVLVELSDFGEKQFEKINKSLVVAHSVLKSTFQFVKRPFAIAK